MLEYKDMHVLIVDDMEMMRKVNSEQLRALGAKHIELANNGMEALTLLRDRAARGIRTDLVVTDLNMPVMNGLGLIQGVRDDPKLANLPIVMVTAEASIDQVNRAIDSGVSELLLKPYTAQKLSEKIEIAVMRARRGRAAAKAPAPKVAAPEVYSPSPIAQRAGRVAAAAKTAGNADTEIKKSTILVVDDTPDNLRLMSGLLADEYRVRVAHNGSKALSICTSDDPPDLVLLDVMMPDMDGFEVAQHMREHPTSETIPIIFVTALDNDDARRRSLDLGAMDFVSKPIEPNELVLRVRNFMRYVQLHKQRQANYDEMLEAARLREDIDRMLRHDLKGPLAGVIGLAQQMCNDGQNKAQHGKWKMVEETVEQVLDTINLSAEMFKIETGRYQPQPQPIPIGEMLHNVADIARIAFQTKKLTLSVDTDVEPGIEPPKAMGDPKLCHSVFHNLVKNACEAAPVGSKIDIVLHDRDPLGITIGNKGVVPQAMRELLFTKYATSKRGGSGLGTYSARLLIEAQGGSVNLNTYDDENRTVVVVNLPR